MPAASAAPPPNSETLEASRSPRSACKSCSSPLPPTRSALTAERPSFTLGAGLAQLACQSLHVLTVKARKGAKGPSRTVVAQKVDRAHKHIGVLRP